MNRKFPHNRPRISSAKHSGGNLPHVGPPRSVVMRGFMWLGLSFILASVFITLTLYVPLWAQLPEADPAVQTPEAINPQYEYNVKAAFLYSFGRYVVWPDDSFSDQSAPFVLGIYGEDNFGQILDRIAQVKLIQGRRIVIEKMAAGGEIKPCHLLFISHSLSLESQEPLIKKLRGKAVLLVGEVPGFAERGGAINFFVEGGTVQFEINIESIRRAGLILDAKLLNLGKKLPDTAAK